MMKDIILTKTAIYDWLSLDRNKDLQKYLEKGNKKRKKKQSKNLSGQIIKDRVSIHDRPDVKGVFGNARRR